MTQKIPQPQQRIVSELRLRLAPQWRDTLAETHGWLIVAVKIIEMVAVPDIGNFAGAWKSEFT